MPSYLSLLPRVFEKTLPLIIFAPIVLVLLYPKNPTHLPQDFGFLSAPTQITTESAITEEVLNDSIKLRVWATSYDRNCRGCNEITATGTLLTHGVCAVDPKFIRLGTYIYVPGYGVCRAEDTGGKVKGAIVDLGFEDVKKGWWRARWTDAYLLPPSTP